jgi:hypothetical protein
MAAVVAGLVMVPISITSGCGDDDPVTIACVDSDGDGFGDACGAGADCDDGDASVYQVQIGFADGDGDGYTIGGPVQVCSGQAFPDGFAAESAGTDCDDGAAERFQALVGWVDSDGDEVGSGGALLVCSGSSLAAGFAEVGGDCDDTDASLFQERLGFVDADGDGAGGSTAVVVCAGESLPTGFSETASDCDDTDASLTTDCASACVDVDGDGHGLNCEAGPDCDDENGDAYQTVLGYADADGDGVGDRESALLVCTGEALPGGIAEEGGDCNDGDDAVYQPLMGYHDQDGDGAGAGAPMLVCSGEALPEGYAADPGDCGDLDVDNIDSCDTCDDADGDGWFFGCDAYTERQGPDCDAGDPRTFQLLTGYRDWDGDTYTEGDGFSICSGASLPPGYSDTQSAAEDCADFDALRYQSGDLYVDLDGDEYVVGDALDICYGEEVPPGFFATDAPEVDCDDYDDALYQELTGFRDWDGDGHTLADAETVCSGDELPGVYLDAASADPDCDDRDATINADATEIPGDMVDQDCDGSDPLPPAGGSAGIYFVWDDCTSCGSGTKAEPFASLFEALTAVATDIGNEDADEGLIYVAAGEYELDDIGADALSIYGGWEGDFTGPSSDETLVFALGDQVVNLAEESEMTVANVTLRGEGAFSEVVENDGTLTLRNVRIEGQAIDDDVDLIDNNAVLTVYDSTIASAIALDGYDAIGLNNDGSAYLFDTVFQAIVVAEEDDAVGISSVGDLTVIGGEITVGRSEDVAFAEYAVASGIEALGELWVEGVHITVEANDCDGVLEDPAAETYIDYTYGIRHYGGETQPVIITGNTIDVTCGALAEGIEAVGETRIRGNTITVGGPAAAGANVSAGTGLDYDGDDLIVVDNEIRVDVNDETYGLDVDAVELDRAFVGGNTITVGSEGDNYTAVDVSASSGRAFVYDNTVEVADGLGAGTIGTGIRGPRNLVAVGNEVTLGDGPGTLYGITQTSGDAHIAHNLIQLGAVVTGAYGIDVDESSLVVAEHNEIVLGDTEGDLYGIRADEINTVWFQGNAISTGDGASNNWGLDAAASYAVVSRNQVTVGSGGAVGGVSLPGGNSTIAWDNDVVGGPATDTCTLLSASADDEVLIAYNRLDHSDDPSAGAVHGVVAGVGGNSDVIILANVIDPGSSTGSTADGIDAKADRLTIINNLVIPGASAEGVVSTGVIYESGWADIVNNTIIGPTGPAFLALEHARDGAQLVNNLIASESDETTGVRVSGPSPDLRVVHNLFYGTGSLEVARDGADLPVASSVLLNTCAWDGCSLAAGNVVATAPGFVDGSGGDYHLIDSSPAVDAGLSPHLFVGLPVPEDVEGDARNDGLVDIGADEYAAPAP